MTATTTAGAMPHARTSLPRLRPYQAEIARAILGRVASRAGGSISVEIARQGGKNELSAQVELATLVAHTEAGGALVKCAPTLTPQARISLERLTSRATAAGLGRLVRRSGQTVHCGRARAHFLSAERHANVVGHTADLLLEVDEAQEVDAEKFDRDFRPMAASTNAPVIFYGTPWGARSLLARATAEHIEAERRDGVRRHFRHDWTAVAECVPAYAQYVEGERARLGERHPLFRTQYLLEPLEDAGRLFDAATLAQIEGSHDRQRTPRPGERYVAGLDLGGPDLHGTATDRDETVLTIARVTAGAEAAGAPLVEVVEHQSWRGEATESLVAMLADRLRRVWRVRRLAVDATGIGAPVADLLTARLGRQVVEAVAFTAERKSRLGGALGPPAPLPHRWQHGGGGVPPPTRARTRRLPRLRRDALRRRPRRGA
ncbi:MAG: hypothetical protein O2919_04975 [Chloroflexi bacterium]|nr:hypothetical protein [Chloroflexota bacterium]